VGRSGTGLPASLARASACSASWMACSFSRLSCSTSGVSSFGMYSCPCPFGHQKGRPSLRRRTS
jgi:hypothetical protein